MSVLFPCLSVVGAALSFPLKDGISRVVPAHDDIEMKQAKVGDLAVIAMLESMVLSVGHQE